MRGGVRLEKDRGPGRSRIADPDEIVEPDLDDATEEKPEDPILCRRCGIVISSHKALFTIDSDRIARVFANPHGFLHEVITARWARNLTVVGPATTEFTWYPGYAWEIATCAECRAHIGWAFNAVEEDIEPRLFWGLRRSQVSGA